MVNFEENLPPRWEITENWLTRKPNQNASLFVLISVFLVVFGSYIYWDNLFNLAHLMPASSQSIYSEHQIWRAWSALVVHGDLKHLISNLFLFAILGYFLSGYFGPLFFPITAFLVGGLTNLVVVRSMAPTVNLIGLSGVVFWMGGAWLILYFLIETRRTQWQKALRAIGVALVLFMPSEAFDPNISYYAHWVGFGFGLASGVLFYCKNRTLLKAAEIHQLVFSS